MTTRNGRKLLIAWLLLLAFPVSGWATSPVPTATAPTPSPGVIGPTATRSPVSPTTTATPFRAASPRATTTPTDEEPASGDGAPASDDRAPAPVEGAPAPIATAVAPRAARAYRTPERAGGPVFMAPDGSGSAADDAPEAMPGPRAPGAAAPAARGGTSVVVIRATARTAIEGFDVRVSYPRTLGTFATNGNQADCTGGTGILVVGSDRGSGELRLLVAGARALPLPIDVFCRFALSGGGGVEASQFAVRVAEVTSDAKQADSSLLIVNVVVR